MGHLDTDQEQFFYEYRLDDLVPSDHIVRKLDAALNLGGLRAELAPFYSHTGRPSIDPELMLRMLVVGYVFAIRSERQLNRIPPGAGAISAGAYRPMLDPKQT